jgi:hypothetical protein
MIDENLFDESGATSQNDGQSLTPTITIPDNVKELIGEGKKYSTVELALAALGPSQTHIQKIEEENRQLREKAAQAVDSSKLYETVQELLKKERTTSDSAPLDVGSVEALLDRKLTERENRIVQDNNATSVKAALIKKYGSKEKAQEYFTQRSEELGVNLTSMSKTSPRAALELLGIKGDSTPTTTASSRGSMNTEAFKPTEGSKTVKTVMSGASTKQIMAAWEAFKPKE